MNWYTIEMVEAEDGSGTFIILDKNTPDERTYLVAFFSQEDDDDTLVPALMDHDMAAIAHMLGIPYGRFQ